MVNRIEARIGPVDWVKERQDVDAAKHAAERPIQQVLQIPERSARQAINVGNELRLILHPLPEESPPAAASTRVAGGSRCTGTSERAVAVTGPSAAAMAVMSSRGVETTRRFVISAAGPGYHFRYRAPGARDHSADAIGEVRDIHG